MVNENHERNFKIENAFYVKKLSKLRMLHFKIRYSDLTFIVKKNIKLITRCVVFDLAKIILSK